MSVVNLLKLDRKRRWKSRRRIFGKSIGKYSGILVLLAMAGVFHVIQNGLWLTKSTFSLQRVVQSNTDNILVGRASVIDGDTIRIDNKKVRLHGIDAPEIRQTCTSNTGSKIRCGSQSTRYLKKILQNSSAVKCKIVMTDSYGRLVGDCFRADGKSLAVAMVESGHALDWPKYSRRAYASSQKRAKARKLGLWAYKFEMPWDYRRSG